MAADQNLPNGSPSSPVDDELDLGTVDEACLVVGGKRKPISKATYYRGVKAGRYTAPIRVGPNISRVSLKKLREQIREIVEGAEGQKAGIE